MIHNTSASFFLGANTPVGFKSFFDELYYPEDGWKLFIIKGGPGTGKSTLMKRIAAEADKRGFYCERIYCSSDPASLDAVIIPRLKISIADGTPPHTLEPAYPGVSETIVDLGQFRDDRKLCEHGDEIIKLTKLCSAEHKKCISFLAAAKSIDTDTKNIVFDALRREKAVKFATKLAQTEFGTVSDTPGKEKRRFLSAVTPLGNASFFDTFRSMCERTIVFDDNFGLPSVLILNILKAACLECGHDCICCYCPTDPDNKPEHLIIPELSLGFYTANRHHPFSGNADKTVDCKRFLDTEKMKAHKNRITFDRRARDEMLDEAVNKLINAKKLHDKLEKYYVQTMDFDKIRQKSEELIKNIFKN